MEKKKVVVLTTIAVAVLLVCVVGATFAYYVASVGGTGNTTNNQTSVTAVDLGSIKYDGVTTFTGTNLYPGQKFVQEFKIRPNSTSGTGIYEIDLESILPSEFGSDVTIKLYKTTDKTNNNVVRTEGTLVQSNGQYYQEDTITVNGTPELVYDSTLTNSSQIILEQADFDVTTLEETTYYLVYEYANNGNQDAQQGKTFNGKVTVRLVLEKLPDAAKTIIAQLDTSGLCPTVNADGTVNITAKEDTNALVCSAPDDYGTSYYFRGAVENNWVKFGGYYWRILRVNGDNSIRMIYAGDASVIDALDATTKATVLSNGYDDYDTKYTQIGTIEYNEYWKKDNVQKTPKAYVYEDNAGVGYMYGNLEDGQRKTTSKLQAQTNTNDSDIKAYIDNWYAANLANYENYISDTLFCNDRTITSGDGYSASYTYYRTYSSSNEIKLTCQEQNDRFTVDDEVIGNGDLTYPVGTVTIDEAYLAGGYSLDNYAYYLYTGNWYWTMSPSNCDGNYARVKGVDSWGNADRNHVYDSRGVRAVINLKSGTLTKGSGSASDPWRM